MRAPVIDFSDQLINDELAVYICDHNLSGERCNAQILQATSVQLITFDVICALEDDCINIYDEPTKTVISSAIPIDGNNIHCLKCNGIIGFRKGSLIIFDSTKLREMMIYSLNRAITNFVNQMISEDI